MVAREEGTLGTRENITLDKGKKKKMSDACEPRTYACLRERQGRRRGSSGGNIQGQGFVNRVTALVSYPSETRYKKSCGNGGVFRYGEAAVSRRRNLLPFHPVISNSLLYYLREPIIMHAHSSLTKRALQTLTSRHLRYRYSSTITTTAITTIKPLTSILIANRGEIALFVTCAFAVRPPLISIQTSKSNCLAVWYPHNNRLHGT